jgi:murein L,D-transpeptidase YcbB/YkuD
LHRGAALFVALSQTTRASLAVEYASMHSARMSILAGTALALIFAVSTTAGAAPQVNSGINPVTRDYSTPGSMPKPSAPITPADDGLRFRGMPSTGEPTPLAPGAAAPAPKVESKPEPKAEPQPAPAAKVEPPKAPVPAPVAAKPGPQPQPLTAEDTDAKFETAPAAQAPVRPVARPAAAPEPAPASVARPVVQEPAPRAVAAPEPVTRPAAARPAPVAAKPTPAPNAASDSQVGDKIREIIASKQFERFASRKPDRDAMAALYQKVRNFKPLWVADGTTSERAGDVLEYLRTIEADGLDPRDYSMPRLDVGSAEAQAEAELKFTAMLLTYVRHASTGRVHFSRVSPNIDYKLAFDADDALKKIAASNDLPKTLEGFNPQQPAYRALKEKLAELRNEPMASAPSNVPTGPYLKYARDRQSGREMIMTDPRVPALRERLGLPAENNKSYNLALANAVAKFQKANGLKPDGELGNTTIAAMNPPSRDKQLDAVLATMERWRGMPRDLGRTHVMLNIPDYNLRVLNNGSQVWQTRVVVGKPGHETPLLTETMKYITVNPTWNVPQSIIYKELLPIYESSDPQIFERQGLKVERNPDGSIRVYQPPGERNALGQIRFNFPNKFLVYQHDTPEKHYFAQDKRAYSHGCMRVQNPMKYAEVILSFAQPKGNYTEDSLRHMLGGEERQIDFANQIPVHITYQTALVDDAGKLQFRDDIYSLDSKLLSIMRGSERAVADVGIERPADPNFKPSAEEGNRLRNAARGGSGNVPGPFGLFGQLFR